MTGNPRPLTSRERAVLDLLLAALPSAPGLREQAGTVEVVDVCGCGCPSIDFVLGRGSGLRVRVDAAHRGSEGGLFLWTVDDPQDGEVLGGIEWVGVVGADPPELPEPGELAVV